MNVNQSVKKMEINPDFTDIIINKIKDNFGSNRKKLLDKIKRAESNETIILTKMNGNINKSYQNLLLFPKKLDYIKEIKQEKEKNDIDKIYLKWNREKIISKINNRYNNNYYIGIAKEEKQKYSYQKFDRNSSLELNSLKNNKKNSIEKNSLEKNENKLIEKNRIEILKEIEKKNKRYSSEEIKDLEKEREKELEIISQKSYLILGKKEGNFIEKLEYIIEVGRNIKKEIIIKNNNNNLILPGNAIYENDNIIIKFLGYFGSELSLNNVKTYIETIPTNDFLREITFKIITSGLATQKIYKLIIEDENYKKKFNDNINN